MATGQLAPVSIWDFNSSLTATVGPGGALVGVGAIAGLVTYTATNYQVAPGSAQIATTVVWPAQGTANATAGFQGCVSTVGYSPPFLFSYYLRYSGSSVTYLQPQWSGSGPSGPWTAFGGPFYYGTSTVNAANGAFAFSGNYTLSSAGAGQNANFCFQVVAAYKPGTSTYVIENGGTYVTSGGQYNIDVVTLLGVPTTPTQTPSNSPTSSLTPSSTPPVTPSHSSTASLTPSASSTSSQSATLSLGASVSNTPTPTRSVTPTVTSTPTSTPTPSPTSTPLSPYPYRLTLNQTNAAVACSNHMDFVEVMVFSSTGQNIAASALGAVATLSTTSGTAYASYGNDMWADPLTATNAGAIVNGACVAPGYDTWSLSFPPAPGFPQGFPVAVSAIYYVNRITACCALRVNTSGEVFSLISPNGTTVAQRAITTGATVSSFFFNDQQTAPIYPNPASAFQTSPANQAAFTRYIRITAAPNACLYFRELFVFDSTLTNVALFKAANSSAGASYTDPSAGFVSYPSYGVDGIIDMDNVAGNMVNLPCNGTGWWQVDLGGVYNLTSLMFFNRFPGPLTQSQNGATLGAQAQGATVTYLSGTGAPIGTTTLNGNMIQNVTVILAPLSSTPTPTGSLTASPTGSITGTPTVTASVTSTSSITASTSATSSASPSLSLGSTPSATPSPSYTPTQTPSCSQTGTQTPTQSGTPTGTPTPTPSHGPLSYGSTLLLRVGDGTAPASSQSQQPSFIEEWSLPTSNDGAAQLLQTLTMPSTCNNVPGSVSEGAYTPVPPSQGFLTASGDNSFLVFACSSSAVGSGSSDALQLGTVALSGGVTLVAADPENTNPSYQMLSFVAVNRTLYYMVMVGGSDNGNSIYSYAPATGAFVQVGVKGGTSFSGATVAGVANSGWANARSLFPLVTPAGASLYLAYANASTVNTGTSTCASFSGINVWGSLPTASGSMDPCASTQQYSHLVGPFSDPRGFLVVAPVPPATAPSVIWTTDLWAGVSRFTLSGSTWTQAGPYTVADINYGGVSLSADGSTAYVTATRGVYAMSTATMTWLHGGAPVVSSPSAGTGFSAIYRGVVLSPVAPSTTPTPTTSPTGTGTGSPSPSISLGSTPSITSSASVTARPTTSSTLTPSNTHTSPTATRSPDAPLSVWSTLLLRVGDGTASPSVQSQQPSYIEEWSLPTSNAGAAQLLQVLNLPGACNNVPGSVSEGAYTPVPPTQGLLTASADGTFVAFACSSSAVGSGSSDAQQLGMVGASGTVSLIAANPESTNAAYQMTGLAPISSSAFYYSVVGGSSSGNGVYFYNGAAFSQVSVSGASTTSFSGATGAGWNQLRNLQAQTSPAGVTSLYVAYAGTSSASSGGVAFSGINQFSGTAGRSGNAAMDAYSATQYVQVAPSLAEPRGFVIVPPTAPHTLPSIVWATDLNAGLYRFSLNASTGALLGTSGPFTVNDVGYGGVSLSGDGSTAYLTATGGVYALSTSTLNWLNNGNPVVTSPSAGTGLSAIYRGVVLSPVSPSSTGTPTSSRTRTPSASESRTMTASASATLSSSASATSSVSVTQTPSTTPTGTPPPTASLSPGVTSSTSLTNTPSSSATPSSTPSSSNTASSTHTQTATNTPSATASPSSTASSSHTPPNTGTPTQTGTPAVTHSPTHTPTQTATTANRPLTYGSTVVLRVGSGATSAASATTQQVFLDEYMMPTAGSGGTAALLQSLALPSTCTLVPSSTSQGALTLSADGQALAFACFQQAVGNAYSLPAFSLVTSNGGVDALTPLAGLSNPYMPQAIAAVNASFVYIDVGGGANANGIYLWTAQRGTTKNVATDIAVGDYGSFTALAATSAGLWMAYSGAAVACTPTPVSGLMFIAGTPGYSTNLDACTGTALGTTLANPRGFVVAPGSPSSLVWATDLTTGLYRIALTTISGSSSWSQGSAYAVTGESGYSGVASSADGSTVYVTASKGIYGFSTSALAWLASAAPLVAVPSTGASNAAVFRGIALSPVFPTPSVTATVSPTASVSPTPTNTATPSSTATASASISFGSTSSATASGTASPSHTPSNSPTSSWTPSASHTPPATGTASPSPLSGNPVAARVATSGTGQCLNFMELFVFDVNGRDVGASAAGASLTASSTHLTNTPNYGGDLLADPYGQVANQQFVNDGCTATSDYYQAVFPAAAGFPGGYPIPISAIYFINRLGGENQRIVSSNGQVQLWAANGSMVAAQPITSNGTVSTFVFATPSPAATPNPASAVQQDPVVQALYPRFVRITAAAGACLSFRELFVFDANYINVALMKPTTSSALTASLGGGMGNDGVIDFDGMGTASNRVASTACNGTAWWQVDLGGVYNISKVILFNYYPNTVPTSVGAALGLQMNGAKLQLLNSAGSPIGAVVLNGSMIQTYTIPTYLPSPSATAAPTPSNTASSSASVSSTSSVSATSTNTGSASGTGTGAATSTNTVTRTGTKTGSSTRSVTATPTGSSSASGTAAATSSSTAAATVSGTGTDTPSSSGTSSATNSGSSSASSSQSVSATRPPTNSVTRSASRPATASRTRTPPSSVSATPSASSTPSGSLTAAVTVTPVGTGTPTASSAVTTTPLSTHTGTGSSSNTRSGTAAATPSLSGSVAATPSKTGSAPSTPTKTGTRTSTSTKTGTHTGTGSKSSTRTPTASKTSSKTATKSKSVSASRKPKTM